MSPPVTRRTLVGSPRPGTSRASHPAPPASADPEETKVSPAAAPAETDATRRNSNAIIGLDQVRCGEYFAFWDLYESHKASDLATPAVLFHDYSQYDDAQVHFSDAPPALACLGLPFWRERAANATARSAAAPLVSFCVLRPAPQNDGLDVSFTLPSGDLDEAAAALATLHEDANGVLHPVLRNKLPGAARALVDISPLAEPTLL